MQGRAGSCGVNSDVLGAMRDTIQVVRTDVAVHILQPPEKGSMHVYYEGRRHLPSLHPPIHAHETREKATKPKMEVESIDLGRYCVHARQRGCKHICIAMKPQPAR